MVRGKLISSFRTCNMAALPRTWFLCFLLSSNIEVVVYFHEFHQKPTTLDGDGVVISMAHLMSDQWHVSTISVKYREKYLKRRLIYSCSHPGSYNPTTISNQEAHMIYGNVDGEESRKGCKRKRPLRLPISFKRQAYCQSKVTVLQSKHYHNIL